jgi:uncharacterized membrane-anchored protein YjiN (DUF445 family)
MQITKEDINYNKLLVAKHYFKNGKITEGTQLLEKIEKDTDPNKNPKSKLIIKEINKLYNDMGLKKNKEMPLKIKTKEIKKFAPPPMFEMESENKQNKNINEMIILAKFHFEKKNSESKAFSLVLELISENKEQSYMSRKVMVKTLELCNKMNMDYFSEGIIENLKKGKWGNCEPEILNKLTKDEKKDLWSKTKEIVKNASKPIPEGSIPSIFMMKI